jgi:hypothetical protein
MQIVPHPSLGVEGVVRRVQVARDTSSVEELYIRSVNFLEDGAIVQAFLDLFQMQDRLWKEVSFFDCTGQVSTIVEALLLHARVQYVCIFAGQIDSRVFQVLSEHLPTNASLKEIRIKSRLQEAQMSLLATAVGRCEQLESLDLTGCTFELNAAQVLARGLEQNRHLKRLILAQCYAGDEILETIIQSIQDHPTLEELILYGNMCRAGGLVAVSQLLQRTPKLTTIDLTWQDIDDGHKHVLDFSALSEGLIQNTTLRALHLSRNLFLTSSIESLADALTHNQSLEHLSLRGCHLNHESIAALAMRIPSMKGLKRLWLHSNKGIGEAGAQAVLEGLQQNVRLLDIVLSPPEWKCTQQINYILDLNWAGRSLVERKESIPSSLWPYCLERMNQMKLSPLPSSDKSEAVGKKDISRRASILYFFVREVLSDIL